MDSSINGCYFNDKVLEYFYTFLKEQDKTLYDLISFAIMPNHVHILFKQLQPISEVIRVLKAKSAININKIMKRKGKFWAREYFDKVIRDEVHFEKVYRYIYENPLKVELGLKFRYYSIYEDLDADMPII
ncbi:MAG: transposase [Sulfurimonas sp.]|nr:transposase [Sulfurimonas sp.]